MKNKKLSLSALGFLVIGLLTLTSCNRGYGCPYDFSIADTLNTVLKISMHWVSIIF